MSCKIVFVLLYFGNSAVRELFLSYANVEVGTDLYEFGCVPWAVRYCWTPPDSADSGTSSASASSWHATILHAAAVHNHRGHNLHPTTPTLQVQPILVATSDPPPDALGLLPWIPADFVGSGYPTGETNPSTKTWRASLVKSQSTLNPLHKIRSLIWLNRPPLATWVFENLPTGTGISNTRFVLGRSGWDPKGADSSGVSLTLLE